MRKKGTAVSWGSNSMVMAFICHKNKNSWVKVWFEMERLGVSGVAGRNWKVKVGKVFNTLLCLGTDSDSQGFWWGS